MAVDDKSVQDSVEDSRSAVANMMCPAWRAEKCDGFGCKGKHTGLHEKNQYCDAWCPHGECRCDEMNVEML